jgi:hypothetical protein
MINIILELTLKDDMVDFLADPLHMTIFTNLSNDEFVEFRLAEFKVLINWLRRIGNNLL